MNLFAIRERKKVFWINVYMQKKTLKGSSIVVVVVVKGSMCLSNKMIFRKSQSKNFNRLFEISIRRMIGLREAYMKTKTGLSNNQNLLRKNI